MRISPGACVARRICRSHRFWMFGSGLPSLADSSICLAHDTARLTVLATSLRGTCITAEALHPERAAAASQTRAAAALIAVAAPAVAVAAGLAAATRALLAAGLLAPLKALLQFL